MAKPTSNSQPLETIESLFAVDENETVEEIEVYDEPTSEKTVSDDEEFDRLLNEFINSELKDIEIDVAIEEKKEDIRLNKPAKENIKNSKQYEANLYEEENALYGAYKNFTSSINQMAKEYGLAEPDFSINAEMLYPRYKPKVSNAFIDESIKGWDIMLKAHGKELANLNPSASDDDLLNFAEHAQDETLQLALISYVEILIEIEGCEIAYEERRIKAKRHYVERKMVEEHEARQAKIKQYIARIEEQKFPINSERLVVNYFKTSRKDPEGAREILINNPATFAPIEINKIPDRLFGLIKSKPEDGIRFNKIIGNFLKRLKE